MKAGFCCPLPPARTGVADYGSALLAEVRRHGTIEVAPREADVFLYHLGNNQLHRAIYRRALARPGVVVLHDAVLQHFFLGSLDEAAYIEEFVFNYGEWQRDLARELWHGRASSALDSRYFRYPMLKRIAARSRAVVVHNPAAARMVREHWPPARVIEIPHLFAAPALPSGAEVVRFRQRLGIPARAFVFGVFGYLRESKRLMAILRAFPALPGDTWLLVAGDFLSSDLARAAAPLLDHPRIVRLPYLPERQFWRAAAAVDACINLRHPAAGETSGIAIRLMGIGKPVFVSAGEETSLFPEAGCLRVDPGIAESESLLENMNLVSFSRQVADGIGRRGADHIALHHSLGRVAEQYWKTLCEHSG